MVNTRQPQLLGENTRQVARSTRASARGVFYDSALGALTPTSFEKVAREPPAVLIVTPTSRYQMVNGA